MNDDKGFKEKVDELLQDTDRMISEAKSYLLDKGVVLDLTEWVTAKEYCRRFGIKNIETITNWIARGVIPTENVRVIEEFNNIRLIKAVPYHVKSAKVG